MNVHMHLCAFEYVFTHVPSPFAVATAIMVATLNAEFDTRCVTGKRAVVRLAKSIIPDFEL